jgi:hypothetical protein
MRILSVCLLSWVALTACGGSGPSRAAPAVPSAAVNALIRSAEPAGAIGIAAAKQRGPTEAIVVTGRVAGVIKGLAAFTLMDLAIPYCGETSKDDGCAKCPTPWDYCCEPAAVRTANSLLVEARGVDGKPLVSPAIGVQVVDRVAVSGKLTKDEHGNFVLLADGWFRQERPQLPDNVRWPE